MTKKIKRPTGSLGELLVEYLLAGSKIVRKPSHDIKFMGTKVEIKSARASLGGKFKATRGWFFNLHNGSQHRWAFRYWFVCFNELWRLERLYVIPREVLVGKKGVYIGPETQKLWEKYKA